jgi:hypothetical protein
MQFTDEELKNEGIFSWDIIKDQFDDCPILLGNGFSLNFSETLRYRNLFDSFITTASNETQSLFKEFTTSNFETVLQHIDSTTRVLNSIHKKCSELDFFKSEIRQGLIDSIHRIHPTPDQIDQNLIRWIGPQIIRFKDIFTTNYDLFLYYVVLEALYPGTDDKKFGDYFYYLFFGNEEFNLFNPGDEQNTHHVYYLHGALFLFENGLNTLKIKKDEEHWLINKITEEINKGNYPLFISEGTSIRKQKEIQANYYLSYCLRNFSEPEEKKLVVFGQSLNEQDNHLVKIIDDAYEKVAISINPDSKNNLKEIKAEKHRLSALFKNVDFVFYNSKTIFNFVPNWLIQ